jgi:hypothetical protein
MSDHREHHAPADEREVYGVLAEFHSAEELLEAARRVRDEGYTRFDAFAPLPIHGLAEAMGVQGTRLPLIVLAGGIIGGSLGYLMQWYMTVVSYPLNIAGRPLHSWPSFIPVTFELTILGAALAAVLGMLALNGLPRPHHPLFGVPEFNLASQNQFFLCIESTDAKFDAAAASDFLHNLGAAKTTVVEN